MRSHDRVRHQRQLLVCHAGKSQQGLFATHLIPGYVGRGVKFGSESSTAAVVAASGACSGTNLMKKCLETCSQLEDMSKICGQIYARPLPNVCAPRLSWRSPVFCVPICLISKSNKQSFSKPKYVLPKMSAGS